MVTPRTSSPLIRVISLFLVFPKIVVQQIAFTKLPGPYRCPPSFTFGRESADNATKSQCIFFPQRPSIFSLSTVRDRYFPRKGEE